MAEKFSEFTPLFERAVRRDGTMSLKIIQPGWGSSGYYPKNVIERDIPKVFPAGTKMFWNHATASEEMERPEGDLRNLAAVTVSDPIWLESGPNGPGMYADARPFAGYAGVIDEIGGHIGVSIRGMGRHTTGEMEGKNGRIIQEIAAGKSVDFVTEPGAGGAIVQIFESAPNAGKLPDPHSDIETFLSEAGRVLSKANETKLKAALEQLTAVLSLLDSEQVSEAGGDVRAQTIKESDMSEQELKEAQTALAEAKKARAAAEAQLGKLQERLVLSEAKDFVAAQLKEAGLPDVTVARLKRALVSNPPVKDGALDVELFKTSVETAVTEAKAEIAALLGKDGRVTGNGEGSAAADDGGEQPTIEAARKRMDESLAKIGYGGANNG